MTAALLLNLLKTAAQGLLVQAYGLESGQFWLNEADVNH
jgi:hypothetical protein